MASDLLSCHQKQRRTITLASAFKVAGYLHTLVACEHEDLCADAQQRNFAIRFLEVRLGTSILLRKLCRSAPTKRSQVYIFVFNFRCSGIRLRFVELLICPEHYIFRRAAWIPLAVAIKSKAVFKVHKAVGKSV